MASLELGTDFCGCFSGADPLSCPGTIGPGCNCADPNAAFTAQNDCVPRAHFDTFVWACVTVFQVLSGENWNSVMFDGWRSVGPWAILYYFSLVVFGNFIVLNLFLAILLNNFGGEEDNGEEGAAPATVQNESIITCEPTAAMATTAGSQRMTLGIVLNGQFTTQVGVRGFGHARAPLGGRVRLAPRQEYLESAAWSWSRILRPSAFLHGHLLLTSS